MDEPIVTLHDPTVVLDYMTGEMEICGRLSWDDGPPPEVVWIWAYFLNPGEKVPGGLGSRSADPIKLLNPLRGGRSATVMARGHFHWWNNSDAPKTGYLAKISLAAASSQDAQVPVAERDYSTIHAVPVESRT